MSEVKSRELNDSGTEKASQFKQKTPDSFVLSGVYIY